MPKDLTPEEYQRTLDDGWYDEGPTQAQLYAGQWEDKQPYKASSAENWWNWWTKWKKTQWNYDSIEERIERKKKIETALKDFKSKNGIIAKTYIGSETKLVRKKSMYSIWIENSDEFKSEINIMQKALDVWKKLPSSQKVNNNQLLLSTIINSYSAGETLNLFQWTQLWEDDRDKCMELARQINDTLNSSSIDEPKIDFLIDSIPDKLKKDIEDKTGHGGISEKIYNWRHIPCFKKSTRLTPPPQKYLKFPHLVKWKRINKWFIQRTDYKALKTKEKLIVKRRKLLVLLDGSWSMRWNPYDASINFIASLMDSNMFDISVVHSSDRRVTDVTSALKKWTSWATKDFINTDGSEWFDVLTDRLGSLTRDEDYVVVLTDMEVPNDAERNLKDFIWTKKHLILSFEWKWKFKCNVRQVKKYEDMMAVVTTLLA